MVKTEFLPYETQLIDIKEMSRSVLTATERGDHMFKVLLRASQLLMDIV